MIKNETKYPEGILATDLKYPSYKSKVKMTRESFELWYTARFGWVIPTLDIAGARRGSGMERRTYAIALTGEICTVGKGPHVLQTVTVYVKESRLAKLQKFLDLRMKGLEAAHNIRDRISTRRANTVLRRSMW